MGWFSDSKEVEAKLKDKKAGVTTLTEVYHDSMYEGAAVAAKKTSRGLFAMAGSGFGKGVLALAAITLVIAPVLTGLAVASGAIGFSGAALIGGSPALTSIPWAAYAGLTFLLKPVGLLVAAIAGTLGAVYQVKKEHDTLNADQAKREAELFAMLREKDGLAQEPQLAAEPAQPAPSPAPAPIAEQKPQAPVVPSTPPPEQIDFVAREEARRSTRSSNLSITP
jgi:hypothetical protein